MTNPLLEAFDAPFGLPPFAAIRDGDFAPAFDAALAEARARIAAIAGDPAEPDFANVIAALEQAERLLDRVSAVFYNLAGSDTTEARQALERDLAPKLAAFSSDVLMNADLWRKISALWAVQERLALTPEQRRVLMLYERMFRRAGAALDEAARERMRTVTAELAVLSTRFSQNVLADERDWSMDLADADLAGLPAFVVDGARAAATERGRAGHVLTLSRSLIVPFLQYSPRRDLREKAYRAWVARGENGGATDNRAVARDILALRAERAALLGYPSFADFKLEPEMAGTPAAVRDLLMQVWGPARAKAEADQAVLAAMMRSDGINGELEIGRAHV